MPPFFAPFFFLGVCSAAAATLVVVDSGAQRGAAVCLDWQLHSAKVTLGTSRLNSGAHRASCVRRARISSSTLALAVVLVIVALWEAMWATPQNAAFLIRLFLFFSLFFGVCCCLFAFASPCSCSCCLFVGCSLTRLFAVSDNVSSQLGGQGCSRWKST